MPTNSGFGKSSNFNFGALARASSSEISFAVWPPCWRAKLVVFLADLCGELRLVFLADQAARPPARRARRPAHGPPARCNRARSSPPCAPCSWSRRRSAAAASNPARSISRATWTISSSDGVISPLRPMMSTFCSRAVCQDFLARHHHAEVNDLVVVAARARRRRCSCRCHARRP